MSSVSSAAGWSPYSAHTPSSALKVEPEDGRWRTPQPATLSLWQRLATRAIRGSAWPPSAQAQAQVAAKHVPHGRASLPATRTTHTHTHRERERERERERARERERKQSLVSRPFGHATVARRASAHHTASSQSITGCPRGERSCSSCCCCSPGCVHLGPHRVQHAECLLHPALPLPLRRGAAAAPVQRPPAAAAAPAARAAAQQLRLLPLGGGGAATLSQTNTTRRREAGRMKLVN
jgi:hypothetical protein